MKIGVRLESLGLPLRRALTEASKMAVGGVQVDARGDLAPDHLTATGRREFRNVLRGLNLELTAVNCPMRYGLDVEQDLDVRLDHVRKVMSLAVDLGPGIVIVEAGRIPDDPDASPLTPALIDLSRHGDRHGGVLALEAGLDPGEKTAQYLARFDTGSLGVNYDPADLLMNGHDPVAGLAPLAGKIVHSHAHDARRAGASRPAQDVALGAGDIEWMGYLASLEATGYQGWIVVERMGGDRRLADVAEGVKFLRRFMGA